MKIKHNIIAKKRSEEVCLNRRNKNRFCGKFYNNSNNNNNSNKNAINQKKFVAKKV
jgi:hypothetical protein